MKNYSLYGLPDKIKFCKLCVISNQRPSSVVEFRNKNNLKTGIKMRSGICDACNYNSKKNFIDWKKREDLLNKILRSINNKDNFYFVHSFSAQTNEKNLSITYSKYNNFKIISCVNKNNIYGCQFHPEKSGVSGLKIFKNFLDL